MESSPQNINLSEWKKQLHDCFQANPWIYWSDFLLSVTVGYGSFLALEWFPSPWPVQAVLFLVSIFALYRATLFIHELTHQERSDLPSFSLAWNLLIGIPTLFPSFLYRGVHIDHHKRNTYSTGEDGEYLPLGVAPFWKTIAYIAQSFYLPVLLMIRFGLLAPISLLHPALRRLVMAKASALSIRYDTVRKVPGGIELRNWYVLEFSCFSYLLVWTFLLVTGTLSLETLIHVYFTMVAMFAVNSVRTVVAHRYKNRDGHEVSFQDQLLDSVNLEGNALFGELVAPVGLRFHALHHLFPSMPYHSLATAHKRLRASLPKDSFYHQTVEPGLLAALITHWKNTQEANRKVESLGTP
jgi:fatty acid desaturase